MGDIEDGFDLDTQRRTIEMRNQELIELQRAEEEAAEKQRIEEELKAYLAVF